jgi:WD40 repeat protein
MNPGVSSLTFGRGGKLLASGGQDGRVNVWNVETGEVVFRADISTRPIVDSVVLSSDESLVAAGFTGTARESGLCIWRLPRRMGTANDGAMKQRHIIHDPCRTTGRINGSRRTGMAVDGLAE